MTLRVWVLIVCGVLAVLGGTLLHEANVTPQWKDEGLAFDTIAREVPDGTFENKKAYAAFNACWFRDMDSLRTRKWPLYDMGSGLLALAISAGLSLWLLRIRTRGNLFELGTPSKRWVAVLFATIAWFGLFGVFIHSVFQGFSRFENPPWGDSLAIPLFSISALALMTYPVYAAAVWFGALRGASLPVKVWTWHSPSRIRTYVSLTACTLLVALALLILVDAIQYGPYSAIPEALMLIYVALIVRAAAISRPPVPSSQSG